MRYKNNCLFFLIFLCNLYIYAQDKYTDKDLIITGLSGGGDIGCLAISPVDQNMMMGSCLMTGVYLTTNGPKDWRMVHHTDLLQVVNARPCFHPKDKNVIYAPTGNRLKISRDKGKTWNFIGNIGRIEFGMAIHPEKTDLMLAGSGKAVSRSLDGGINWSKVEGPNGSILGFHFDRTSSGKAVTCFAATSLGVWRSDDGGETWIIKNNGLPKGAIVSFGAASNKKSGIVNLFCGIENTIYRSTDKGENWLTLAPTISGKALFIQASDVNPSIIWAAVGKNTVFRSEDSGNTWLQKYFYYTKDPKFNLEHNYFTSYMKENWGTYIFYSAVVAPSNPDFFMFGTEMLVMYTDDAGKTWKNAHTNPVQLEGEAIPTSFKNTGLNNTTTWHYYIDPFEHNRHYISYTDIGFSRSIDSGKTWIFFPYLYKNGPIPSGWGWNQYEMAFDPEIPGKMWGAFSKIHDIPNENVFLRNHLTKIPEKERTGGIGCSTDFAANWEFTFYNNGLPNRMTISVIVDPRSVKNNRTLYAAVYEDGIYKSTDDGKNWIRKSEGLGSATNKHVVRVQLHKDGTLFALVTAIYADGKFIDDGTGLFRSINAGESWSKVNATQPFLWPKDFTVHPDNSHEIYVSTKRADDNPGCLWRTNDGGETWEAICKKDFHFGAYLHPTRPGWIYTTLCEGNDPVSGLWLSKDNGKTWIPYTKIPHRWIQRVDFDPKNPDVIYVSTFGASAIIAPADPKECLSKQF